MELQIKDVNGTPTLCKPEPSIAVDEKNWELLMGFIKEQKCLWNKYLKENGV